MATTIPEEVISHHILPYSPKEFFCINNPYHLCTLQYLISDSRYTCSVNKLLLKSIDNKNIASFKKLLASPKITLSFSYNKPLQRAIYMDFIEAIQQIIRHPNFDPSERLTCWEDYLPALSYAVINATNPVFECLLSCPLFNPAEQNNLAIGLAMCHDKLDKVKLLLQDNRVDPSTAEVFPEESLPPQHMVEEPFYRRLAFATAIKNNCASVVELVISDPRMQPMDYELEMAIDARSLETVQVLLNDGRVMPTIEHVWIAICDRVDDISKILIHDQRFTLPQLQVLLRCACVKDRPAIVEELLTQLHVKPGVIIQRELVRYSPEVQKLLLSKVQPVEQTCASPK